MTSPEQRISPEALAPDRKWNGWRSKRVLGAGGQGEAHLVERMSLSGTVEYGVLKSLHQSGEQQRRRFANELEALSKVQHGGILKIIERPDGEPFFVSEYCEGHDLASRGTKDWSIIEKIRFFLDVVDAVGAAHAAGIIHRDLKPPNILLRKDRRTPVIADFGICFLTGQEGDRVTMTPEVAGSRSYRAPELERGRLDPVLPSCDSYSLGKVLYWLLSEKELHREYHREPEYDLTNGGTNGAMNLVYELLDQLVVEKASGRLADAHVVATETTKLVNKLEHGAHVLRRDVGQHCSFCFDGTYVVTALAELTEEQAQNHVRQLQLTINYKRAVDDNVV